MKTEESESDIEKLGNFSEMLFTHERIIVWNACKVQILLSVFFFSIVLRVRSQNSPSQNTLVDYAGFDGETGAIAKIYVRNDFISSGSFSYSSEYRPSPRIKYGET